MLTRHFFQNPCPEMPFPQDVVTGWFSCLFRVTKLIETLGAPAKLKSISPNSCPPGTSGDLIGNGIFADVISQDEAALS